MLRKALPSAHRCSPAEFTKTPRGPGALASGVSCVTRVASVLKNAHILAFTVVLFLACAPPVQAASDAEFQRLLSAPDDPQLNRQYAASAEATGDLRHALAALDRALAVKPNDPELIAAYDRVRRKLLPTTTAVTIQAGATYASNPRQLSDGSPGKEDDAVFDSAISIEDERTLGGMRIRSLAYAAGQWNVETSDISTGVLFAQAGPVFALTDDAWVHVAPGVGTEWLDDTVIYTEASATITLGTVFEGMTQTVTTSYAARFGTDSSIDYPDSQLVEVLGRFVLASTFTAGDYIYFQPGFRWSDTFDDVDATAAFAGNATIIGPLTLTTRDLSPYGYTEWGGRIAYFVPLDDRGFVFAGAGISVYQRDFDTDVFDPALLALGAHVSTGEKRGDVYIEPTAHLIFPSLVAPNVDFRADYRLEHNDSNDASRDFNDHVAGVRVVGRY